MTTTATLTLADFLLARIADDENRARAAQARPAPRFMSSDIPWVAFLATYADPARVLADCEAKRRIIEDGLLRDGHAKGWEFSVAGERILRDLALPYQDHPDYRQEWRP